MGSAVVPFSDLPKGATIASGYSDLPQGASLAPPAPSFTANPNNEGTYKMVGPDGSNVSVPFSQVRGAQNQRYQVIGDDANRYQKDAAAVPAPAASPQDGLFTGLGRSLGINTQTPSLKDAAITGIEGPAGMAIRGVINQAKQSYQQAQAARAASDPNQLGGGNRMEALQHIIRAVPVAGPALMDAANQVRVAPGDTDSSYGHQLMQTVTSPGTMGTLIGASAQLAPMALGAMDSAVPGRPLVGQIPSAARAGASFSDLNSNLANQPVSLTSSSLEPLQRAAEVGARGSSLPKAVSDLLTRSQSPIDMTFPEARDYQGALSDMSQSDKNLMNGRMKGAVAQLSKGLYGDIYDAADSQGMGPQYASAMKDYGNAMRLKNAAIVTGKTLGGVAGLGGVIHYLNGVIK